MDDVEHEIGPLNWDSIANKVSASLRDATVSAKDAEANFFTALREYKIAITRLHTPSPRFAGISSTQLNRYKKYCERKLPRPNAIENSLFVVKHLRPRIMQNDNTAFCANRIAKRKTNDQTNEHSG